MAITELTPPAAVLETQPLATENSHIAAEVLGRDCPPCQQYRELTQNSIDEITKSYGSGKICWDITYRAGIAKARIVDNGPGIEYLEMTRRLGCLASSGKEQGLNGNFGWGAKIASLPHNRCGIEYTTLVEGEEFARRIVLWEDPTQGFGLMPLRDLDGELRHMVKVSRSDLPRIITRAGHGTQVVLLGNDATQDTALGPDGDAGATKWLTRYLNGRYFKLMSGIELTCNLERSGAKTQVKGRRILGQNRYLTEAVNASGTTMGEVRLTDATVRWYVFDPQAATGRDARMLGSAVGAVHDNEVYERYDAKAGIAKLKSFGVVYGHAKAAIFVFPDNAAPNSTRSGLTLHSASLPWDRWATEFYAKLPTAIAELVERSGPATSTDTRGRRASRFAKISGLFTMMRYRPGTHGSVLAVPGGTLKTGVAPNHRTASNTPPTSTPPSTTLPPPNAPPPTSAPSTAPPPPPPSTTPSKSGKRAHAQPTPLTEDLLPQIQWISTADGTRTPLDLEDRPGEYFPHRNELHMNADFRGYTSLVNYWMAEYGQKRQHRALIVEEVRAHIEEIITATILLSASIRNTGLYDDADMETMLSPVAMTAVYGAVRSPDTAGAIRRNLGTLGLRRAK